jgi:formylglycine-generating enzyme required for sulfatase activity/aminoglycoside phosphotransferase (APT) family kinase protein
MTLEALFDRMARALAGRYQLERELGHGGMGTVFLAADLKLGRRVAIKVLPPNTRASLGDERFQREVRLVAALSHPHIVPLFEADEADDCLYYVMEYIEGETLADRLRREGPLPLDDALRIVREIGDALQYAHERGLVHRDVKPANILLARRGHALLADFGIAKLTDAGGEQLTGTGIAIGTAEYMSPEQASGERRVDARSDVYALGAVLFEMLVGEPPFTGPTVQAVVARIMAARPQSIRMVRSTVPVHVEETVLAALAKTPADRPASARAFVDRLMHTAQKHPRRLPGQWLIVATVVVLAGVVGLVVSHRGRDAAPAGMSLVPGGTFRLFGGDCPRCLPPRAMRLDSFYIDRTEVPVAAYARYVAAGMAPAPWAVRPMDSLPATGVFWKEAAGYCRWHDALGRLPTEEEWEAAARGPRGDSYPWGAALESGRANADNVRPGLAPVGTFPSGASAGGVLDLIGNAWEWTATPAQSQYVIRGGAFNSPSTVASSWYRASLPAAAPDSLRLVSYGNTGFRCVRAVR